MCCSPDRLVSAHFYERWLFVFVGPYRTNPRTWCRSSDLSVFAVEELAAHQRLARANIHSSIHPSVRLSTPRARAQFISSGDMVLIDIPPRSALTSSSVEPRHQAESEPTPSRWFAPTCTTAAAAAAAAAATTATGAANTAACPWSACRGRRSASTITGAVHSSSSTSTSTTTAAAR